MGLGNRWTATLAVAGLAFALVPLSFGGPTADSVGFWSIEVTYDVDPGTGEVTLASPYGAVLPAIDCQAAWQRVSSSAESVPWQAHSITYAIDYQRAELQIREQVGDTVQTQLVRCPDPVIDAATPAIGWQQSLVDGEDSAACDGPSDVAGHGLAPLDTSFALSTTHELGAPVPCVAAQGATLTGPAGSVPFTGQVSAVLTDDQGSQVQVTSCTLIAGSCWGSGPGWSASVLQGPGERAWTLSCEASTLFGLELPTAGSFGCQAWFG